MNRLRLFFCASLTMLMIASFSSACDWTYLIWIPRSATADPVYQFTSGDKMGYIDRTGKILILPNRSLSEGVTDGEFHDGLLEIGVDDGLYIDTTGKNFINKRFYRGWSFSEGLAVGHGTGSGQMGIYKHPR